MADRYEEGRQSAFAAMVEEAAAITLGAATDRPSIYNEFMQAIRRTPTAEADNAR